MANIELNHLIRVTDPTVPLPLDAHFDPAKPLELEIGCGNGRFLATRAARNPDVQYIGIERLLGRVRKLERKAQTRHLDNLRILRLEALYTLYYLFPTHRLRTVYVFFPDPWPKRHHHIHRLFSPLFLDALWDKLEVGGTIQIATDHPAYFEEIQARFAADARFAPYPAMERDAEEQTDFEMLFRSQGLPIGQCAYQTLPGFDRPLPPMTIPPEMEPDPAKHPEVEWETEGEGEG
ncbi:MAG: tRNA (guanosine(46)-N7)-methyltransferase TrmB [Kiritimatiellae bacterium]|nr:tRNA (guanosine(46)-N7)-methyltransferase TrmB [Kiritimatiellia bacterium]